MLLAIDIGNTNTVFGICNEKNSSQPDFSWRLATRKDAMPDDIRSSIYPLLSAQSIDPHDFTCGALASVVPALGHAWKKAINDLSHIDLVTCDAELATTLGLFKTNFTNTHEIGADRIADVVAATHHYGTPVVVVDFGTATNIEVVDETGMFLGGIIAPGIETSASALFSHATRLATIDLVAPHTVIGRNTEEAVQSGIIYGETGRVDGLVNRIFDQLGYRAPVVATGGLAKMVASNSSTITEVNLDLTLEGLFLISEAVGC